MKARQERKKGRKKEGKTEDDEASDVNKKEEE